ncbi:MAG: hypothetical protein HYR87_07795 [Thaumarchaeota archaeon]|nr:hypothetical protein [Nitrososphaerota archaeon]
MRITNNTQIEQPTTNEISHNSEQNQTKVGDNITFQGGQISESRNESAITKSAESNFASSIIANQLKNMISNNNGYTPSDVGAQGKPNPTSSGSDAGLALNAYASSPITSTGTPNTTILDNKTITSTPNIADDGQVQSITVNSIGSRATLKASSDEAVSYDPALNITLPTLQRNGTIKDEGIDSGVVAESNTIHNQDGTIDNSFACTGGAIAEVLKTT